MFYSYALSIYLLHHNQKDLFNQNIWSIQDAMRSDNPAGSKLKRVCTDLPNMVVLNMIATPGDIQVTYAHASVRNKSLGKAVTDSSLAGSLEAPTMVSIDIKSAFSGNDEKTCVLTMDVLLCAAVKKLKKPKNICDLTSRNVAPLPPFLMEAVVTDGETAAEAL